MTKRLISTICQKAIRLLLLSLTLLGMVYPAHAQPEALPSAVVATNCTLYASPTGSATNNGTSPSSPLTLVAAYKKTAAGSVVCLLAGTYGLSSPFYINKGGTASAYITYQSYDSANPAVIKWSTSTQGNMFQVGNNASYIRLKQLKFNGNNSSSAAIKCSTGSHHLEFNRNTISNAGTSGISAVGCDYLTIVSNKVFHTGFGGGWGSGITLNSSQWYDQAAGFHSFVVGNIVAGTYDNSANHSDGNGIIMDRGDNTPAVLIANNLIYQNGGRCIHIKMNRNKWVVNNTCYSNSLDGQLAKGSGSVGEYSTADSANVYYINNVVYAWTKGYPFLQGNSTQVQYFSNVYYGGKSLSGISSTISSDPKQLRKVNPLFVNPSALDLSADGQYRNAVDPSQVGNRYQLQASSTLVNAGIDPRTVAGVTAELRAGLDKYVLKDLNGTPRPQGASFDIGAYEQ